tara:strand:+ start:11011 stop:11622 length:612 start_codon:yes stop_codon:yes gene_type:complete
MYKEDEKLKQLLLENYLNVAPSTVRFRFKGVNDELKQSSLSLDFSNEDLEAECSFDFTISNKKEVIVGLVFKGDISQEEIDRIKCFFKGDIIHSFIIYKNRLRKEDSSQSHSISIFHNEELFNKLNKYIFIGFFRDYISINYNINVSYNVLEKIYQFTGYQFFEGKEIMEYCKDLSLSKFLIEESRKLREDDFLLYLETTFSR